MYLKKKVHCRLNSFIDFRLLIQTLEFMNRKLYNINSEIIIFYSAVV